MRCSFSILAGLLATGMIFGLSETWATGASSSETTHIVSAGETLFSIALHYYGDGTRYRRIAEANGLKPPYVIHPGQKLLIPGATAETASVGPSGSEPTTSPASPEEIARATSSAPLLLPTEMTALEVEGDARLIRSTEPARILRRGTRLEEGDILLLDSREARVLLSTSLGERLVLEGAARFEIRELSASEADSRRIYRLESGRLEFAVPHRPDLSLFAIHTPSGRVALRSGEGALTVLDSHRTAISIWRGEATVSNAFGVRDVPAGRGMILRTLEPSDTIVALPETPHVTIETAPHTIVVAIAAEAERNFRVILFSDADGMHNVGGVTGHTDQTGVAVRRLPARAGRYWIRCTTLTRTFLEGIPTAAGPILLREDNP
ncbi:MAG: LysM peptidoglycan-binding domain-containing protein [Candidatus Hydrogenedentota bacterium]|nr:MAG: LysM peptidoglycan-binding domain-containing protein [Candidatus Hydrogenedentota bacterium]